MAAETLRSFMGIEIQEDSQARCPGPIATSTDSSLSPQFVHMIELCKIASPSPVQCQFWPAALANLDIIAIAATGSGKTLAYLLPSIHHILQVQAAHPSQTTPSALVVVPTRELAQQVVEAASPLEALGVRALALFGGVEESVQESKLRSGEYKLVVGTPGRLCSLIGCLLKVSLVVLDECDQLLNLGFEKDLATLAEWISPTRQTFMLSATFPDDLRSQALSWMKGPANIRFKVAAGPVAPPEDEEQVEEKVEKKKPAAARSKQTIPSSIKQIVRVAEAKTKPKLLLEFLQQLYAAERKQGLRQLSRVLVFVNTKVQVQWLAGFLKQTQEQQKAKFEEQGIPIFAVGTIFGKLTQDERDTAIQKFKKGSTHVLVATDLAARGLDIKSLSWVVNFDFPKDFSLYTHRVGRTGRADRKGHALTFITSERDRAAAPLIRLLKRSKQSVPKELIELARWSKEQTIAKGDTVAESESDENDTAPEPEASDGVGGQEWASLVDQSIADPDSEVDQIDEHVEEQVEEEEQEAVPVAKKMKHDQQAVDKGKALPRPQVRNQKVNDDEEEAPILQVRHEHARLVEFANEEESASDDEEDEDEEMEDQSRRKKRKRNERESVADHGSASNHKDQAHSKPRRGGQSLWPEAQDKNRSGKQQPVSLKRKAGNGQGRLEKFNHDDDKPYKAPKWKEWKAERRSARKDDGPKLTRKDRKQMRAHGIRPEKVTKPHSTRKGAKPHSTGKGAKPQSFGKNTKSHSMGKGTSKPHSMGKGPQSHSKGKGMKTGAKSTDSRKSAGKRGRGGRTR